MLAYLSAATRYQGIAGPTLVTAGGDYGNAILTRHTAGDVQRWDLSVPRCEPRGAIAMLEQGRMDGAHRRDPPRPVARRAPPPDSQAHRLHAGDRFHAHGVDGDLNEWFLWGRPLRWLHRRLGNPPRRPVPGALAVFALDRIWVEPRHALRDIGAHQSATARMASDHLPVTATIHFSAQAGAES